LEFEKGNILSTSSTDNLFHSNEVRSVISRLHDQAGLTSWLCVSWTSQLDVCLTFGRRLLDVCWMFAGSCRRGIRDSYSSGV